MYSLISEHSFDAAHFLKGYEGKCSNIHGHRWRVVVEIQGDALKKDSHTRGMLIDFDELKETIKKEVDYFDHCLIIKKNSLKENTYNALKDEGFRIVELDFRSTAENFSKYFYDRISEKGYQVKCVSVYETSNNCAVYGE